MPTVANYASSFGLRVDQAKWGFALPDGARRLIASGDFDGRDNETLVKWLTSDKVLSERLLRWCNSPAYNSSQPYENLDEVARVTDQSDFAQLAVLAFARGLFLPGQMVDGTLRDRLWGHSIAVGTVASMISRTIGRGDPSLTFIAGSLHDIGLCANQRLAPDTYRKISSEVDELSPMHEVEQDLLGWDHAQLGEVILRQGDAKGDPGDCQQPS